MNDICISVIVAVYNPGKYLQRCMDSLLGQSLDPDSYEVILVDDGSTDGSGAVLDDYAATHANVSVHHQENSGWPGKPRNVGVGLARGEYVQFVDQDDALGSEALARQYAFAKEHDADVLIGKIVNTFGGVAHDLFVEDQGRCTLGEVIRSLSPHKVFRRDFLLEHNIRFPEGKWRLEDQLFMVKAYLAAGTISILADYPCYYWLLRDDGKHASWAWSSQEGYFTNLRTVLDVVDARIDPGPLRDSLLKRFLEQEVLYRLGGPLARLNERRRAELYAAVRKLYFERFHGHSVVGVLTPIMRLRAALLAEDRMDALLALVPRVEGVRGHFHLDALGWDQGSLRGRLTMSLRHENGAPLTASKSGSRYVLDTRITTGLVDPDLIDVTDEIEGFTANVSVKHRESSVIWYVPSHFTTAHRFESTDRVALAWSGEFEVDPAAGGDRPLAAGINRDTLLFDEGQRFRTYRPRIDGRTLIVKLPLVVATGAEPRSVTTSLRLEDSTEQEISATLTVDAAGDAVLTAIVPEAALAPRARGELSLRLPGDGRSLGLARLRASASGRTRARPSAGAPRRAARLLLSVPWVRRTGKPLLRRLPIPIERRLRRAVAWAAS